MASHRYWRINIDDNYGSTGNVDGVEELYFYSAADGGGTDLTGTAIGGSELSATYSHDKAFDRNNSTFWLCAGGDSGTADSWIGLDFGTATEVLSYRVVGRSGTYDRDAAAAWRLQVSDDGTTWTTLETVTGQDTRADDNGVLRNVPAQNEWDLSTVSENLTQSAHWLDMSVTVSSAEGLFISPTGDKMYVVTSGTNDYIYEYNLSRNYDVSTATYVQSLNVNPQENQPREVVFKTDGTKMYLIGSSGDDINQYSLSTAWDLSTATFDSVTFSVSSVETNPQGLAFKPDGTKVFITGASSDIVAQASLSTAWDLSTATLDTNTFSVATQEASPEDIAFKSDGTKMYVMGGSGDDINEYTLSTAWDITTATYSQTSPSFFTYQNSPVGFIFNSSGTEVYVLNNDTTNGHRIQTYTLSTAWDVSTLAFKKPTTDYFEVGTQEPSPYDVFFKPDGLKMYVIGSSDFVYEYDLSTAWYIHTASYLQSYDVGNQETGPKGLFFKSDGTKMYVAGSSGDDINQYTLSTAWDVTTASFDNVTFSFATQEITPHNIYFKSDGTELYVIGTSSDSVHQYTLTTGWDVSTASFTRSFSVATQETNPAGLFFKDDGTRMYIGGSSDDVQEYILSTAWDISTATHNYEYQQVAAATLSGMFWRPNGETLFLVDRGNPDTITAHYVEGATLPTPIPAEVTGLRTTVIEYNPPKAEVTGLRTTVIEYSPPKVEVTGLRTTTIERSPVSGGLTQVNPSTYPVYIADTTSYVKFEPNTNNKQLMFYPTVAGDHYIIALRPNLLDFYEATQTFTLGSWQQVNTPHFNQLFITSRTLTSSEITGIKNGMLSRAVGTGIDIDAGTTNSVPGGLQDPSNV